MNKTRIDTILASIMNQFESIRPKRLRELIRIPNWNEHQFFLCVYRLLTSYTSINLLTVTTVFFCILLLLCFRGSGLLEADKPTLHCMTS